MNTVTSWPDFKEKVSASEKTFLFLYKSLGEQSQCAMKNLENALDEKNRADVYTADVDKIKDIHEKYGINTVPSLLVFENGKLMNSIKGCHESSYYKMVVEKEYACRETSVNEKSRKRVTVYSTPTCSWCNSLKSWLRKNNISFSDIDVSVNTSAAEEMTRKTGQRGVPQTDINGRMVVGFNQVKLKELLEIQ